MYQRHWGMKEWPFRRGLDTSAFYQSGSHEEALARPLYLVEHRHRLNLHTGRSGTGKSLLLSVLARQFSLAGLLAGQLSLLGITAAEFPALAAEALGIHEAFELSPAGVWREIQDTLRQRRYVRQQVVLLLDDADEADPAIHAQIAALLHLDPGVESPLTVIVSAAHDVARLGTRLLELIELRVELEPWDREELAAYLHGCLERAGASQEVFREEALTRLHALTGGVPRRVNQLAELALLAGAGVGQNEVDERTIEMAHEELSVRV